MSAAGRPLVAGVARREGPDVLVVTATRDVRIAGDAELTSAVLSRCDGHHDDEAVLAALAPGDRAAGRELLAVLREHGAVVDATQAWRVLEEQTAVASAFYPAPDDDELAALTTARWRPRATGEPCALDPATTAAGSLAARRASSTPQDGPRPVSYAELGALLLAAYGGRAPGRHAAVASAGALYPLAVHVLVRRPLGPLAPGVWWLDPEAGALAPVVPGPPPVDDLLLAHELSGALAAAGEPVLVLSADIARGSGKYGNRAHRYALLEAGAALHGATLAAVELGVPLRAIGGLDEARTAAALRLDGLQPLLAILLGA